MRWTFVVPEMCWWSTEFDKDESNNTNNDDNDKLDHVAAFKSQVQAAVQVEDEKCNVNNTNCILPEGFPSVWLQPCALWLACKTFNV